MSQNDPVKVPVPFSDASAYFSEEEWKLLHEWQKELYKNVMNEIHQALLSLGPLIATTVCSLKDKENDDMYPMDCKRWYDSNRPPGDSTADLTASCGIKREANHYLKESQENDRRENNQYLKTGQAAGHQVCNLDTLVKIDKSKEVYICDSPEPERKKEIDEDCFYSVQPDLLLRVQEDEVHRDRYRAEGSEIVDHSAKGHEVISFIIKEEQEICSLDYLDVKKKKRHSNHFTSDRSRNRKQEHGNSVHVNDKIISHKAESVKITVPDDSEKEACSRSHTWSESTLEQCGMDVRCTTQLKLNEETSVASALHEEYKTSTDTINQLTFQSDTLENWRPFTSTEMEYSFCETDITVTHQRPPTEARPSTFEHEKNFNWNTKIIGHQISNSEERPYQCKECGKRFNKNGALVRHKRIHTGERPFPCTECGKSFNQKEVLSRHQIIHTGERPYQCAQCGKTFNRKGVLIVHQRIHKRSQMESVGEY